MLDMNLHHGVTPNMNFLIFVTSIEHEDLKRFLPIGYTTVCRSHVERKDQFALRTVINLSGRHVRDKEFLSDSL